MRRVQKASSPFPAHEKPKACLTEEAAPSLSPAGTVLWGRNACCFRRGPGPEHPRRRLSLSVGKDTMAGTSALYPAANCLLQKRGGLKKAGYGIRGDWGKKGDNGSKDGSEKRPPCRCADLSLNFQISQCCGLENGIR